MATLRIVQGDPYRLHDAPRLGPVPLANLTSDLTKPDPVSRATRARYHRPVMTAQQPTQPQEFWRDHVEPNCRDYAATPESIRLAMNAAVSLFHMADWVWKTYHKTDPGKVANTNSAPAYCDHLQDVECDDFELIRDVANAHKHLKLNAPDKRTLASAGATVETTFAVGVVDLPRPSKLWPPTYSPGINPRLYEAVIINRQDGTPRSYIEVLDNVAEMWLRLIERDGL